ncbi:family 2A encapsulin nanocompartment cargo protein cysteine desulfurase [Methylocystis sp. 9N]|uniref:Cysteine desulfurase n=1 Tax=Methylocystis borbori TaxID=3118750 RepID=A0ABU7XCV7_9HYPH
MKPAQPPTPPIETPGFSDAPAEATPNWPDAALIAQFANAFFRAPPTQTPINPSVDHLTAQSALPGLPVAAPSLPDTPAPSVVTSAAPFTPARPPFGPPDIPPTTIPSVVPTPNIPAPSAPTNMQSPTRPFGIADLPQPGASLGSTDAPNAPSGLDFTGLPRMFDATVLNLDLAPERAPALGINAPAVPGGGAPAPVDNLYFLHERGPVAAPAPAPSSFETRAKNGAPVPAPIPETPDVARYAPPPDGEYENYAHGASAPLSEEGAIFARPSEADAHRFSDVAGFVTPPIPPIVSSAAPTMIGPGAAGPAATDALYFIDHDGGHAPGVAPSTSPAEAKGFEPELSAQPASRAGVFDPYSVKRDFPILQQQVHGKPLIWLDNAATTQKPLSVIDRLSHFYEYENSNIHRAAHALAARSTDAYEAAREKTRRFLKAPSVKGVIFVRGATEAINLVAQAWGRRNVGEGDEIVISWLEHHANIVPWQQLCAEKGARLRVAPVDDCGQIILEEYEKLLNPRTRIVALTQVSNALGTVTPVHELTAMAHRHGARVLIDGAQSVSHLPVDVQSIDCDFFVFSGHKVFGPTGIGVVYGKQEVLEHMPPWQGGGNMIADVTFEKTIYQGAPERFEAGTGNIADAVGLGAALDYVEAIGMEVIARYEHDLLVYAMEKMRTVPGLRFIGTAKEKASVLSFVLDGHETQDVGKALDREGIAVRAGHHCAQPILRRFGLEATVRPSLAFYNTCEDVDALVAALLRLQAGYGGRQRA